MISRRTFLAGASSASALVELPRSASAAHSEVTVGAIRWDAWYIPTDKAERPAVEAALGPEAYQSRAPSCATVVDSTKISLDNCGTQERIDEEIRLGRGAGLDYWAYCWYGPDDPMQQAWRLHQSSHLRAQMRWCFLFASASIMSKAASDPKYVSYISQGNYQRVPKGRPLVFLLGQGNASDSVTQFRAACTTAHVGDPYVVLLSGQPGAAGQAGADAEGVYVFAPPVVEGSYPSLARAAENEWTTLSQGGQAIVPTAMTGWDRRPRVEHPMPWEPKQVQGAGMDNRYGVGTPRQIAAHVANMLSWIRRNGAACPSRTGLIYSWDEHDEGGSTLSPTLGEGSAILDAVGKAM